jgi:hypothetical protein
MFIAPLAVNHPIRSFRKVHARTPDSLEKNRHYDKHLISINNIFLYGGDIVGRGGETVGKLPIQLTSATGTTATDEHSEAVTTAIEVVSGMTT